MFFVQTTRELSQVEKKLRWNLNKLKLVASWRKPPQVIASWRSNEAQASTSKNLRWLAFSFDKGFKSYLTQCKQRSKSGAQRGHIQSAVNIQRLVYRVILFFTILKNKKLQFSFYNFEKKTTNNEVKVIINYTTDLLLEGQPETICYVFFFNFQ